MNLKSLEMCKCVENVSEAYQQHSDDGKGVLAFVATEKVAKVSAKDTLNKLDDGLNDFRKVYVAHVYAP